MLFPLLGPQSRGNLTDRCLSVLRNLNGHLLQLSFHNLNPIYSFLDDKQPSNLCSNTSSSGELTTPQGCLVLNSLSPSFLTYTPQFLGSASPHWPSCTICLPPLLLLEPPEHSSGSTNLSPQPLPCPLGRGCRLQQLRPFPNELPHAPGHIMLGLPHLSQAAEQERGAGIQASVAWSSFPQQGLR